MAYLRMTIELNWAEGSNFIQKHHMSPDYQWGRTSRVTSFTDLAPFLHFLQNQTKIVFRAILIEMIKTKLVIAKVILYWNSALLPLIDQKAISTDVHKHVKQQLL